MWTQFWDMSSGGGRKEEWKFAYIEAPEEEARVIFYNRFGHSPDRVTCSCCGADYSIDSHESLAQLTGFHRGCRSLETPRGEDGLYLNDDPVIKEHLYQEADEELPEGYRLSDWSSNGAYISMEDWLKLAGQMEGEGIPRGLTGPMSFILIQKEENVAIFSKKIPSGLFRTVVADPPWPYKDRLPGPGRGAAKHYDIMSLSEIESMECLLGAGLECPDCGMELLGSDDKPCMGSPMPEPSSSIASDAHLYLWTPNAFIHDAWEVAEAWGFEPKTLLTWVKVTKASQSFNSRTQIPLQVRMGMGRSFRNCTEHVIIATRGKLPYLSKAMPNVFFAPRQQHSQKPDIFYDIVESMSPGPRLELFPGRKRPGWTYPTEEV